MDFIVNIKLFYTFAIYRVLQEKDSIYMAKLIRKCMFRPYNFPELIFLHRGDELWQTDCSNPEIAELITKEIDGEIIKRKFAL